ncbi:MAG: CBS domain-containing protein [Verrucomicrobia bacterium]|nr:CBS domain-containing protein [Verrucomicrobiota bacterium]
MVTAEDILRSKSQDIITVSPKATIAEALAVMTGHNIGSILITEGDAIRGIWTERDLMRNSLKPDFNPRTSLIQDHMVTRLVYTPHTDTIYQLIDRILGLRHRRLLIQRDGQFIGLLTQGDVMKTFMLEKSKEVEGLNAMVSWEYYEEWRWTKERGQPKTA